MSTNQNSKPFKTHNQQLKILRNRNLKVDTKYKRSLEQIGYYALINGYKLPFLEKDSNGRPIEPDRFINNSSFKEIQCLYNLDCELRSILYQALIKYETILRAEISYHFSEIHQEEHAYLAIDNFDRNRDNAKNVVTTISILSSTIQQNTSKKNAISHYVNKYGHVPLWVLVNFLTFGTLNYFYKSMTRDIRTRIAKDFSLMFKCEYRFKICP